MAKYNDIDMSNWNDYTEIETDSLWIIDKRDNSGAHSGHYHGNFVPQIPFQLLSRYTKKGEKYPDWLMSCLRQRFGIEPNDPRFDSVIEKYSPQKVVDEYLMWQGIIGWTPTILNVVETAYGISLPYEVE